MGSILLFANRELAFADNGQEITDERSQDLGKMFLLFQLHPNTAKFTTIDLGPLKFSAKECANCWMCWSPNLMGFKSSPYNSIRMCLVLEEIIRGDRHDPYNAFQLHSILLNSLSAMDGHDRPLKN